MRVYSLAVIFSDAAERRRAEKDQHSIQSTIARVEEMLTRLEDNYSFNKEQKVLLFFLFSSFYSALT